MKRVFSFLLLTLLTPASLSAALVPDAKLIVKLLSREKSSIEVALTAPEGYRLNWDAPWTLKLSTGETLGAEIWKRDPKLITAKAKFQAPLGEGRAFTLTYFVCDTSKTVCARKIAHGYIR